MKKKPRNLQRINVPVNREVKRNKQDWLFMSSTNLNFFVFEYKKKGKATQKKESLKAYFSHQ